MNADVNLFGPGNRANATIGRAVRLILRNVFQMIPGISDKSTQGNPGKYSFCIAERARGNPWPLLCETQDYPPGVSSVTVFAGGGFCNVENHGGNTPEQILASVADAMANYGCITLGQSVVILSPEHMRIVAGAGWSREDAQSFLFTHAKRSVDGMKGVGKYRDSEYDKQHGAAAHALAEAGYVHRGLSPDDILITMGGGDAGGHSCFIPSWSRGRGSIMQHKADRRVHRLRIGETHAIIRSDIVRTGTQPVPRAAARQPGGQDHRHPGKRQAERGGNAARGRRAVRGAAWLRVRPIYSKSNASAPGAGQHPGPGGAEVDFLITGLGD